MDVYIGWKEISEQIMKFLNIIFNLLPGAFLKYFFPYIFSLTILQFFWLLED